jgi:phosphatidylinositol-3-phosphatase
MRARTTPLLSGLAVLLALGGLTALAPAEASHGTTTATTIARTATAARPPYVPPVGHVFVINIENKGYTETWGQDSVAPYLATTLRAKGVLLDHYYATAHNSLPNYLAQISGQAPNLPTQTDCQSFSAFTTTGPDQDGQAVGSGCVYPATVPTLPRQLSDAGLGWRGYMQNMSKACQHPTVGRPDPTQHARKGHNYAVRHNPFMYFRSIIGNVPYCKSHVRSLAALTHDLAQTSTTRNLSYITPDLCRDGHDIPCANGRPGGLVEVDRFLKKWAPRILASPAFKKDGVLIITADESDGPSSDSDACCGELPGPNVLLGTGPGISGPGGGRIGALVISRWSQPGSWSTTPYNHYSLLASIEEIFGLPKLGMAAQSGLDVFGLDVYNVPFPVA